MQSRDIRIDAHVPARRREEAVEHRRRAEALRRAGYRDQAAQLLLEARLLDLEAIAGALPRPA